MLTILIKAQHQKDTQQRGKELSTWVNKDAYSEWPMYLLVLLERSVHVGPEQQFLPHSRKAFRGSFPTESELKNAE